MIKIFCLFLGLAFSANLLAESIHVHIVSGAAWKSSDTPFFGWQTPNFDDSGWANARSPYPYNPATPPSSIISFTQAEYMWHDPMGTSDGTTGAVETYYRYTFALSGLDVPIIGFEQTLIFVDDDYDFYVNGNLVIHNADDGAFGPEFSGGIFPFLVNGKNVFAIHAVDGSLDPNSPWYPPQDRLYEAVLLDSAIVYAPFPEPSSWILSLGGIAALTVFRLRRSQ